MSEHEPPFTSAAFPTRPAVLHSPSTVPLRFTGSAGEYFRIWIVNVLLTLLTLGVYSAWAKVRTKQYFYRHTFVGDASFEYLASPLAILKGRILMVLVLVALAFGEQFSFALYFVLLFALFVGTPWIIVQALRFNARNSAYRNVRFGFRGSVQEAYAAFVVGWLAYAASCGVCLPYFQWRISQFTLEGHAFGDQPFRFRTPVGDYFIAFLISVALTLPIIAAYLGLMFSFVRSGAAFVDPAALRVASVAMITASLVIYLALLVPAAWIKARVANLFWGGIDVGAHQLESTQTFKGVLHLQVTNVLGVVLTLGLAIPWAMVRSRRYTIENLTLHTEGPLVATAVTDARGTGAFGDAATDLGDFGLDLG